MVPHRPQPVPVVRELVNAVFYRLSGKSRRANFQGDGERFPGSVT
jgi:hypothetical protein